MSKKNINNITFCEVDKTQHTSMNKFLYHLRRLKISEKEYYDKYSKQNGYLPYKILFETRRI